MWTLYRGRVFVVFCAIVFQICSAIYVPNDSDQPKRTYTSGIKTSNWKPQENIQYHHNYSRVYAHNNQNSFTEDEEVTPKIFPVYNAHTYGQRPENKEKIIEIHSQISQSGRADDARNIVGADTINHRVVYKRKIEKNKQIEVYNKCPEDATGQFVYDLACNQFLDCWKGRGGPRNCAPGTLFNPKTLECDFPNKVECITGPRENTLKSGRSLSIKIEQVTCPEGFSGLIPNYTDCSKFIRCNNGFQNSLDCPPGTLFDYTQNVCNFPEKCVCFTGQNANYLVGSSHQKENIQQKDCTPHNPNCYSRNKQHPQNIDHNKQGQYYQTSYRENTGVPNQKTQTNCDLSTGQCFGQTNTQSYYATTYGSGSTSQNRQHVTGSTHNSNIACSPNDQNCQNIGATLHSTSFVPNCNPQTQNCQNFGQRTHSYGANIRPSQGQSCDPRSQICAQSGLTIQSGSPNAGQVQNVGGPNYEPGQNYPQTTSYGSGRQNYNKICNVNDRNCHQGRGSTSASQHIDKAGPAKCPDGFQGLTKHPTNCKKFLNCANGITHVQDCAPGTLFNPLNSICDFPYNVDCGNTEKESTTISYDNGYYTTDDYGYEGYGGGYINKLHGQGITGTSQRTDYPQVQTSHTGGGYQQNVNCPGNNCNQNSVQTAQNQGRVTQAHAQSTSHQIYGGSTTPGPPSHNYRPHQFPGQNSYGDTHYQESQTTRYGTGHQTSQSGYGNQYGQGQDTQFHDQTGEYAGQTSHSRGYVTHGQGNQYGQGQNTQFQGQINKNQGQTRQTGVYITHGQGNQYGHGQTTQFHGQTGQLGGQIIQTDRTPHIQGGYSNQGTQYQSNQGRGEQGHMTQVQKQGTRYTGQTGTSSGAIGHGTKHQGSVVHQNQGYGTQYTGQDTGLPGHGASDHAVVGENTSNRPTFTQININKFSQSRHNGDADQSIISNLPSQQETDYVDVFDPNYNKNIIVASTVRPKVSSQQWPPPFPKNIPSTDINADYVFEYEDGEPVTLEPENVYVHKNGKSCGQGDFHCTSTVCVDRSLVCNGVRECENGKDELNCQEHLQKFNASKNSKLEVLEKERWNNVSVTTCAILCIETKKFVCKSFNYRRVDKACFLTDQNIGLTGALKTYYPCDYYELKSASVDCRDLHTCPNNKCLTSNQVCDGYDDCGDRADEKGCKSNDFGYNIKLAGSTEKHEGRVEITVFGKTGYICDDQFGIKDANIVCKELGFRLGAAEVKGNSYFARELKENNTLYMMDDIDCFGNETTLMDCDFAGWGIHNCRDQEIAGVVCKTAQEKCGKGYWKCDTGNECVPIPFVCDGLNDCTDDSDEGSQHCEAATELRLANGTRSNEGRIEIKHHGIWGSICDDDFNEDAAKVVCNYLGFHGSVIVKKDGYFGPGEGPIWLDQVSCYGNETEIEKCTHWNWGEHNCDHTEDVGVICSNQINEVEVQRNSKHLIGDHGNNGESSVYVEPTNCGYRKDNIFLQDDDVHFRVVKGSIAKQGEYPWQAALRVKGKEKSAHWCGAVVISSKWVLTAAHCLIGYAKGAYIVVAGEYNTDEDEGTEQQSFIEEYYLHEQFRKAGHKMSNDIALIKLKGKGFKLNQDIQPICLPDSDADYERELNCTISGFGSIQSGTSAYSHNLRAAWIPIQKMDTCKMPHVYGDAIIKGMICAGFLDGGVDACDGDSGGPLACLDNGLFTLYGITSWGQHCGYANKPGVYVRVADYKKWIDDTMRKHT